MGRKTRIDREKPVRASNLPSDIHGAPIHGLPTSALLFWLHHFTAGTPTRRALLNEIESRGILNMGRWTA